MAMRSTSLSSTAVVRAAYDDESLELTLTFGSGNQYTYFNVPPDIYEGLASAPSAGTYYNQMIRNQF